MQALTIKAKPTSLYQVIYRNLQEEGGTPRLNRLNRSRHGWLARYPLPAVPGPSKKGGGEKRERGEGKRKGKRERKRKKKASHYI